MLSLILPRSGAALVDVKESPLLPTNLLSKSWTPWSQSPIVSRSTEERVYELADLKIQPEMPIFSSREEELLSLADQS